MREIYRGLSALIIPMIVVYLTNKKERKILGDSNFQRKVTMQCNAVRCVFFVFFRQLQNRKEETQT